MRITGGGSSTRFTQLPASRGAVLVLDNYARYEGGLAETHAVSGAVAGGAFLRSFALGKTALGNVSVPPAMVTSLGQPNFSMGRGTPANAANFAVLPNSGFTVVGPVFGITAVPEPGSWAMLIAGFGIIGAVLRRRAATPGVATATV